jgi:hypothetical protein
VLNESCKVAGNPASCEACSSTRRQEQQQCFPQLHMRTLVSAQKTASWDVQNCPKCWHAQTFLLA